MRLLDSLKRRSKRAEATTDDSQRSSSSWKNTFKLLHWPRRNTNHHHEQQHKSELRNIVTVEDDCTESCLDLFQTLMSNAAPSKHSMEAANSEPDTVTSKRRSGLNYWHTNDPNFLPTAYPLTRMDPRSHSKAKWGSLNLVASAALVSGQLKQFDQAMRDKRPKFRLGPRPPPGDDNRDALSDRSSSISDRSRSAALDTNEPKYTFISQDGKLAERETNRWPKLEQPKLIMRYKLCEPYASNYGKKAKKRAGIAGQKCTLARVRWIYERPIFRLPRSVVNENKRRLLSRHMLKDQHEPALSYRLPCVIKLNESEQFMRFREYQTEKRIREVRLRIAHDEKQKRKAMSIEI